MHSPTNKSTIEKINKINNTAKKLNVLASRYMKENLDFIDTFTSAEYLLMEKEFRTLVNDSVFWHYLDSFGYEIQDNNIQSKRNDILGALSIIENVDDNKKVMEMQNSNDFIENANQENINASNYIAESYQFGSQLQNAKSEYIIDYDVNNKREAKQAIKNSLNKYGYAVVYMHDGTYAEPIFIEKDTPQNTIIRSNSNYDGFNKEIQTVVGDSSFVKSNGIPVIHNGNCNVYTAIAINTFNNMVKSNISDSNTEKACLENIFNQIKNDQVRLCDYYLKDDSQKIDIDRIRLLAKYSKNKSAKQYYSEKNIDIEQGIVLNKNSSYIQNNVNHENPNSLNNGNEVCGMNSNNHSQQIDLMESSDYEEQGSNHNQEGPPKAESNPNLDAEMQRDSVVINPRKSDTVQQQQTQNQTLEKLLTKFFAQVKNQNDLSILKNDIPHINRKYFDQFNDILASQNIGDGLNPYINEAKWLYQAITNCQSGEQFAKLISKDIQENNQLYRPMLTREEALKNTLEQKAIGKDNKTYNQFIAEKEKCDSQSVVALKNGAKVTAFTYSALFGQKNGKTDTSHLKDEQEVEKYQAAQLGPKN